MMSAQEGRADFLLECKFCGICCSDLCSPAVSSEPPNDLVTRLFPFLDRWCTAYMFQSSDLWSVYKKITTNVVIVMLLLLELLNKPNWSNTLTHKVLAKNVSECSVTLITGSCAMVWCANLKTKLNLP